MKLQIERLNAALAGRYAVLRAIGEGGMATVYLARDVRHDRNVAVKVLHPELELTITGARFRNEIEIAARLQHPNILPLLDSGEVEGTLYYVMPYVEGRTLRQRLTQEGELPVSETVRILKEVVDALGEAHRHHIVHRDVKPENILLRGRHALVADFGIAKVLDDARERYELTWPGKALGTPSYMAPEQASGHGSQDPRTDIYAIGVMAYEMLTGRPPFAGDTVDDVLLAQVQVRPEPVTHARPGVPAALADAVMRCLEKRPSDRFQDAEELLQELEPLETTPSGGNTPPEPSRPASTRSRQGARALAAGSALVVGSVLLAAFWPRPLGPLTFGRSDPVTFEPGLEMDPALSPDGSMVAYAGGTSLRNHIYVRSVGGGNALALAPHLACHRPRTPRWTQDGSHILFSCVRSIVAVPSLGGHERLVVERRGAMLLQPAPSPDGGRLAFVSRRDETRYDTLFVQPMLGGDALAVAAGRDLHSPSWSQDGRLLAYVSGNLGFRFGSWTLGNLAASDIWTVPSTGGDPVRVSDPRFINQSPVWMPDGRSLLLVSNEGGGREIFEIPVDRAGRARGPGTRLTTGLMAHSIALSADGGRLAYSSLINKGNIWRVRIPASGTASVKDAEPVTSGTQHIENMDVSPDGTWLAFDSDRGGNADIWKLPLAGGEAVRLTTDRSDDFMPVWSPDGERIAFHSFRNGNRDVFTMHARGGPVQPVALGPAQESNPSWSRDGRLLYQSDAPGESRFFAITPRPDGGWDPPTQLGTELAVRGKWSPDGREVAYITAGAIRVVSAAGGPARTLALVSDFSGSAVELHDVAWARDGSRLFAKAGDLVTGPGIWAIPREGGPLSQVVRFDDASRPSHRREIATDGTWIYFTVDDRQGDVHVLEVTGRK